MSSKLQSDVGHRNQWWRRLVNAYVQKQHGSNVLCQTKIDISATLHFVFVLSTPLMLPVRIICRYTLFEM